jgi:hypothetical protein
MFSRIFATPLPLCKTRFRCSLGHPLSPVRTHCSTIRPSIAQNLCRFRCPGAGMGRARGDGASSRARNNVREDKAGVTIAAVLGVKKEIPVDMCSEYASFLALRVQIHPVN